LDIAGYFFGVGLRLIGGTPYAGTGACVGCAVGCDVGGAFADVDPEGFAVVVVVGAGSTGSTGGGPYAGAGPGSVVFVGAGGGLSVDSFPHAVSDVAAAAANVIATRARRRSFGADESTRSGADPIAVSQNGHARSFARTCRAQPGQGTNAAMTRASHARPYAV
jgi:hypothetical protein